MPANFDMKTKVECILEELEMSDKRARTLDIDDFIKILYYFNKEGIHFI